MALLLRFKALKQLGGLNRLLQLLQQWQLHRSGPGCQEEVVEVSNEFVVGSQYLEM